MAILGVMLEGLGLMLEGALEVLFIQFVRNEHFASGVAFTLIIAAFILAIIELIRSVIPAWFVINTRTKTLDRLFMHNETFEGRRQSFAENYITDIDPALSGTTQNRFFHVVLREPERRLQLAWSEFKETFVDEKNTPIQNTVRPQEFFLGIIKPPSLVKSLGGLFVSIGLLFTFIGIVAVLTAASCSLSAAEGDAVSGICMRLAGSSLHDADAMGGGLAMQNELQGVLTGAASKFYTSIGGLLGSILLRIAASSYGWLLNRGLTRLASRLEEGVVYAPDQKLLVDQLSELQEQSTQLKKFNTDLAVAVGERFERAVQPMATELGAIKASLDTANDRQLKALQEGMGDAIDTMAGGEINKLGATLNTLSQELAGLSGKLQEGGNRAAEQMAKAAERLDGVAAEMDERFAGIAKRLDGAGSSVQEHLDTAANALSTSTAGAIAQMEASSSRSSQALTNAAQTMEKLSATVSDDAASAMRDAMKMATDETRMVAQSIGEDMAQTLKTAGGAWRDTLGDTVEQITALNHSVAQSVSSVSGFNDSLDQISQKSQQSVTSLTGVADSIRAAVDPLSSVIDALQGVVSQVRLGLADFSSTVEKAMEQGRALAEAMAETQEASTEAWEDYAKRFGEVDESLGKVLEDLAAAYQSSAERMQRFVGEIDQGLATGVRDLSGALGPLSNLAEQLEDLTSDLKQNRSEAVNA
ncbi:hypothetical protein BXY39_2177 [Eilatimonas milleporae]|uniref:Uncharacterized protein n=2 Tax=Eilatimonas milleporae TaxID=911205 RepID=A0A3M0CE34_9PROT|nr:hypothetical protein BXY39_2177 [Eilatimonas milleporae]